MSSSPMRTSRLRPPEALVWPLLHARKFCGLHFPLKQAADDTVAAPGGQGGPERDSSLTTPRHWAPRTVGRGDATPGTLPSICLLAQTVDCRRESVRQGPRPVLAGELRTYVVGHEANVHTGPISEAVCLGTSDPHTARPLARLLDKEPPEGVPHSPPRTFSGLPTLLSPGPTQLRGGDGHLPVGGQRALPAGHPRGRRGPHTFHPSPAVHSPAVFCPGEPSRMWGAEESLSGSSPVFRVERRPPR